MNWFSNVPSPSSLSVQIFIVLELITGGELFDKIVAEGKFNEDMARFYFRQLVKGVKYCHNQGVCHRDLKPENLLLDDKGNLKISDFGLSALYTGSTDDTSRATLLHTTCGTPNYVAPEVLNDRGYDGRQADLWSMGVILYVLLAGFLPFDEPHMSALFRKIQKAEFEYPKWFSPEVRSLLDKILVPNPEERISLEGVCRDPWFVAGGVSDADAEPPTSTASAASAAAAATEESKLADGAEPTAPPHVPSAADMASAVTEGVAMETSSESKAGDKDVPTLNAFDVVNMFGGMALNRMLSSDDESRMNKSPQFLSAAPPSEIMSTVSAALTEMGGETSVDAAAFKVKSGIRTPKGEIIVTVHLYALSDSLHLVSISKARGDLLAYNTLFAELRTRLADLVQKPGGKLPEGFRAAAGAAAGAGGTSA